MSKYSSSINYKISTSLDKTGLTQLQTEIQKTINELNKLSNKDLISDTKYKEARSKLQSFQEILGKSFNSNLNMMNFGTLNKELKSANLTVKDIQTSFSRAGAEGNTAFTKVLGNLGKIDTGSKQISKTTDKIFNTIGNTVRWGIVSAGFNGITTALSQSVQYIKELDTSLTNIRVVSDYTTDQMRDFSIYANESAKALGQTTVAFTDATEIFAAQGYTLEDSERLAEMTLKIANTTGQATGEVSEQLTAWINGYQMTIDQAEKTMDKVTAIAAWGAADTEELMTAASKVASVASTLGVTEDQLISQMSTIISVTREAPETVGNALKTLYARIGDLKMGETLEDGLDLGNVSSQLEAVGVQILDVNGDMRNMGDILEDLMARWDDFSAGQKQAIAVTVAGKQQYARFMSLMENDEMYNTTLDQSMNQSAGYLDKAQGIYMDSLEASLKSLEAAKEGIMTTLFNGQDIKPFIDALTYALYLTNEIVKSFGGLDTIILGISSVALKQFSSNIGNVIGNIVSNRNSDATVKNNLTEQKDFVQSLGLDLNRDTLNDAENRLVEAMGRAAQYYDQFDEETRDKYNNALKSLTESIIEAKTTIDESHQDIQDVNTIHEIAGTGMRIKRGENGALDISDFKDASLDNEFGASLKQDLLNQKENIDEAMANSIKLKELLSSDKALDLESVLKNTEAGSDERLRRMAEAADRVGNKIANNTQDLTTDLLFAMEKLGASSEDIDKVMNASTGLTDTLEELYQQEDLNEDQTNELISAQKALEEIIDEIIKKYKTASDIVNDSEENDKSREERLLKGNQSETVARAESAALNETPIQEFKFKNLNELLDEAEFKNAISDVAQLTGALGQLAFGIQTFANLPSIWRNQDSTAGEKLIQTVTILGTSISSLIFAFNSLKQVDLAGSLKTISDGLKQVNTSTVVGSTGIKIFSGALGGLSKVISSFGPQLLGLVGIFTIVSTALSTFAEEQREQTKQLQESYLESFKSANVDTTNFDTLYKAYKETGKVTEELKNESKQLADSLGIAGSEAYIQSGNFDGLAEAIGNAKDKAIELNEQQAANQISKLSSQINTHIAFDTKDVYNSTAAWESDIQRITGVTKGLFGNDTSGMTPVEQVEAYTNALEKSKEKIQELKEIQASASEEDKKAYEAAIEFETERIEKLQGILGHEDYQNVIKIVQNQAQLQAANIDKSTFKGLNAKEALAQLSDTTNEEFGYIAQQAQILGQEAGDQYKRNLLLAANFSEDELKDLFPKIQVEADTTKFEEEIKSLTNITQEEEIELKTVLSKVSDKEALRILQALEDGKSLGEVVATLNIKGETDEFGHDELFKYSQEEIDDLLKRLNVTKEEFDNLKSVISEKSDQFSFDIPGLENISGSAKDVSRELEITIRNLKNAQSACESGSREWEEYQEQIDQATEALDIVDEQITDVTASALKIEKGLNAIVNNFNEWSETLKNNSRDSAAYINTLAQLKTALSDALDIDPTLFPENFVEDNIDLIRQVAAGSEEALQELQSKLALEITATLNLPEEEQTEFLGYLQQLQESWPDLEVGATLNDKDLVDGLNKMLADGALTVNQMNAILSQMGYEPVVGWETVEGYSKAIAQSFNKYGGGDDDPNGLAAGRQDVFTSIQQIKTEYKVPKITALNKKVNGAGGTTITPRTGGSKAPSSGKSGGGGGGGRSKSPKSSSGSGSNKAYEPKSKDPIEEEYDRYKKVNHQLEKNGNQLKTLTTHQERLVQGSSEWLKSTEKRVELINKEIGLNKEKLSIAEQEQKELKDYLAGQGVQFDAEGFFLNGKEVQDKLVKSVNDAINKYNSSTTEADQDYWEKVIEEREEVLKTYQENLGRYAEVHGSLIPELINQLEELEDQIEDIRIGIVKNGLEAVNTLKDMTEKANEFNAVFAGIGKKNNPFRALSVDAKNLEGYLKADKKAMDLFYQSMNQKANDKNLSDAMRNAYKEGIARSKQAEADGRIQAGDSGYLGLMQQYTDVALEQLQQLNDTGTSSIFGKNSEEAYKFAQDVANQAMEMLIQFEEAFEQMHKDILDAIGYMAEYTKDRLALYNDLTEQMEYIADLSTIMYGTSDLALNNALLEKRTDILRQQNNEIRASRAEYQNLLDAQNKELANLKASGASRQEIEYAMERQKALQEQVNKLTQQEHNNVLAIAKIREEIRQNSINQNFKNMDMKFLGNDLDWIKTEWDLINADATEYLDAVNSAYEIQKLQGKYTELLNGSNDLLIQQKITAQMNEQLGFLREQENLSAHDVAYANAKLEALQKQIALEEAQRNKSQMKLRRDSQGNYSYVYTANQDDIADKEAAALDAQNNLYNMEKDYMLEQGQNYLSTYEKFKNAMKEVANNTEISAEERAKRMAALQKAMEKQLNQIVEETTKTQGRLTEEFLNLVDMLTEENKSDLQDTYDAIKEGSFDAFDQVDNRIVDSFHLIVDNADKTQQYIGETVDGIKEAWYEFSESIKEVSSEASTDIENVGNEINKVNDALGSLSSTQQEFINQLKTDAKDVEKYMGTLDDYREKIWNLEKGMSDYKAKVDELNKQNQALQQEKAQMSVQIANLQQSSSSGSGAGGSSGSNGGSGGNSGGFGGTQYSKGQLTEGIAGNIWSYGTWGTDPTRSQRIKQKFGNQAGQEIINGIQKLFNGQPAYGYNYAPDKWKTDGMGYYKKFSYSSFDTGGYTGTWNAADSLPNSNAGRLAVLHQKELVLNAQDTENILRAVYAVRDLTEGLKVNQLDNIMSFTSQMPDITMDNEKEIKQDVHITADFPNVHDGREIEQALLSLNEQAVQYAFKSH